MHPRSNLSKTLHPSFRMQQEAAPLFGERFVIINIANSSLWTCAKILRVTSQSWRLFRPRAINLHIQGVRCDIFQKQKTAPFYEESSGSQTHFGFTNTEFEMHRYNFTAIWFWKISNHTLCNIHLKFTTKTSHSRPQARPPTKGRLTKSMMIYDKECCAWILPERVIWKSIFVLLWAGQRRAKLGCTLEKNDLQHFLEKKYQGEFKEACKIHFVSDPAQ